MAHKARDCRANDQKGAYLQGDKAKFEVQDFHFQGDLIITNIQTSVNANFLSKCDIFGQLSTKFNVK